MRTNTYVSSMHEALGAELSMRRDYVSIWPYQDRDKIVVDITT